MFFYHKDLHCYSCVDYKFIDPLIPSTSEFYQLIGQLRVDLFFGGVHPGPCSSRLLTKCNAGQTCSKVDVRVFCKGFSL